jgi:hypothetical protein
MLGGIIRRLIESDKARKYFGTRARKMALDKCESRVPPRIFGRFCRVSARGAACFLKALLAAAAPRP